VYESRVFRPERRGQISDRDYTLIGFVPDCPP